MTISQPRTHKQQSNTERSNAGQTNNSAIKMPAVPALQKKVAVAQADKEKENDWVILTNLQFAKELVGGDVVDFGAGSDFSNMGENESLAIVGHGSPGSIQGFNAESIVAALTKKDKAMPKATRKLILLCCNAAAPTEGDKVVTSLVGQLAALLREAGYGTIVEGKPSLTQISPGTGINATKPSEKEKHLAIEARIINEHELNFTSPPAVLRPERIAWLKTKGADASKMDKPEYIQFLKNWLAEKKVRKFASELMAEKGIDPDGKDLETRAAIVAELTGPFYKKLTEATSEADTLFKPGTGSGSGTVLAHGTEHLAL